MPNRSYCRFQNTLEDLRDCFDTIAGGDDSYQSVEDLSPDEYNAFELLVDVCRDIVDMVDDGNHVFCDESFGVPDSEACE